MRGSWRVVLAAFVVVVAAALVYALGGSALQMRAMLGVAPTVTPPAGRGAATPPAAAVPRPSETGDVVAPRNAAGSDEANDALPSDSPETTEPADSPAGPPSGAEFAELLEGELAGEADPAAVEALQRALREAASAEQ